MLLALLVCQQRTKSSATCDSGGGAAQAAGRVSARRSAQTQNPDPRSARRRSGRRLPPLRTRHVFPCRVFPFPPQALSARPGSPPGASCRPRTTRRPLRRPPRPHWRLEAPAETGAGPAIADRRRCPGVPAAARGCGRRDCSAPAERAAPGRCSEAVLHARRVSGRANRKRHPASRGNPHPICWCPRGRKRPATGPALREASRSWRASRGGPPAARCGRLAMTPALPRGTGGFLAAGGLGHWAEPAPARRRASLLMPRSSLTRLITAIGSSGFSSTPVTPLVLSRSKSTLSNAPVSSSTGRLRSAGWPRTKLATS